MKGAFHATTKDDIRAFLIIMGIIACLAVVNAYSKDEPRPDTLAGVVHFGCKVQLVDNNAHWRTYVWIEYEKTKWEFLYSIRNEDQMSKSLKDCDNWLKFIRKEIR